MASSARRAQTRRPPPPAPLRAPTASARTAASDPRAPACTSAPPTHSPTNSPTATPIRDRHPHAPLRERYPLDHHRAVTHDTAMIDPMDRSIPAVTITNVIPTPHDQEVVVVNQHVDEILDRQKPRRPPAPKIAMTRITPMSGPRIDPNDRRNPAKPTTAKLRSPITQRRLRGRHAHRYPFSTPTHPMSITTGSRTTACVVSPPSVRRRFHQGGLRPPRAKVPTPHDRYRHHTPARRRRPRAPTNRRPGARNGARARRV